MPSCPRQIPVFRERYSISPVRTIDPLAWEMCFDFIDFLAQINIVNAKTRLSCTDWG